MMRIIHVTREREKDRRYGLGKSLSPVVDELRARGHFVRYVCQSDLTRNEYLAMEHRSNRWVSLCSRIPLRHGDLAQVAHVVVERLAMGRCAARIALEESATHVHCHDPWIAAGLRNALGNNTQIAWGITEHGFGSYVNALKDEGIAIGSRLFHLLGFWEKRILSKAAWVIAPTDSCLNQLARDFGLFRPQAHWHCIPHAKPAINRYKYDEARAMLGWKPEERQILGIGRFALMKRFPLLIEACAQAAGSFDVRLTILGEGDPAPLLAAAQSCGFADRLTLAITDDVGQYLSGADLYVSTSSTESFGMANLEAMVAGAPIICVAGGATSEVVGCGGWLIPGKKDCLVEAINALLSDTSAANAWRLRAKSRGDHWPSPSSIAEKYADIYALANTPSS